MNKPFEIDGYWWLPETPGTKISGILHFSPGDTPSLKLKGTFNSINSKLITTNDFLDPLIIHGVSLEDKPITLYKCFQVSGPMFLSKYDSPSSSEFIANIAFIGNHFFKEADIKFNNLLVRFFNLDNWYNKSLLELNNSETGEMVIDIKSPSPTVINIDDFHIEFIINGARSYEFNKFSITATVWISITNGEDQSFNNYMKHVRLIQNFLTFAISKPTFVTELHGEIQDNLSTEYEKGTESVEIFYSPIGWQSNAKEVIHPFMLLPFNKIEDKLPAVLYTWQKIYGTIKPVLDLYFAGLYKTIYPEDEFINLTQAIETYHRIIYGGKYQEDDVFLNNLYKILVDSIPKEISSDFKESLKKGKLRYANEYSLRKRMFLLTEHIAESLPIDFLSCKQKRSYFSEIIADTRNYQIHHTNELKDKAKTSGKELLELNQKLRLLIKICLLEELDFAFDDINSALKRDRYSQDYLM